MALPLSRTAPGVRVRPAVVLADLGSGLGGAMVHRDVPAAAFVSPTAAGWLAGHTPATAHREQYRQCVRAWQTAGLIEPDPGQGAAPGMRGAAAVDPALAGQAAAVPVTGPGILIAVSADCGFCRQLSADVAANAPGLRRLGIAVLLARTGSGQVRSGTGGAPDMLAGADLDPSARVALAGLAPALSGRGTPAALILAPGAEVRAAIGYDQITAALIGLGGATPGEVVAEPPTNCSATVTALAADELIPARTADDRLVGIAVRGAQARQAVALALAARAPASHPPGYLPITLTAERPRQLFLLFRGGELIARTRTGPELAHVLNQILDGFAGPAPGQVALLCGALTHRDRHEAVLVPRNWVSDLVKNATRLGKAGWQVRPEPHSLLHEDPRYPGTPALALRAGTGTASAVPVRSVWAAPLSSARKRHQHGRLLTQVVNWIARPARDGDIYTAINLARLLPVRAGTCDEALTHLTTACSGPAPAS